MEIKPTFADFPDELVITDPENSTKLSISFWRTVRLPEDGRVFDLPAGLGTFPLVHAEPFKEKLTKEEMGNADVVIPMYDREAMYMEFQLDKFDFSNPQRPFAVRPYVGGINAISGESLQSDTDIRTPSAGLSGSAIQTRVGEREVNEVVSAPPKPKQDYLVMDISIRDVSVHPQWLDGIAVAPGRVKQFVCVPFGSSKSIESQKRGKDEFGGIQLEIIPSLPLSCLRPPPTKDITLHINSLCGRMLTMTIDQRALVWDLLYKIVEQHPIQRPGVHLDFNQLIYQGQGMEPLATLDYYSISNESTVHVIEKLRGGCGPNRDLPSKRMAMGVGGAISQNIKRDSQPPLIWDYSRSKVINIQIANSLAFEDLTGIVAPQTPIDFRKYQELGVPFFPYYLEDAQAISGDFKSIQSVGSIPGSSIAKGELSPAEGFWSRTPDSCSKCNENAPFRL